MIPAIILSFAGLLADQLFSWIVENYVSVKIKENKLKHEIKTAIETSLNSAIGNYPGSEYIFENFDVGTFLIQHNVINQINKLFIIWEKPDENVLFEEWIKLSGNQNPGNLLLILRSFILELSDRFRKIPEIQFILNDRDNHETRILVGDMAADVSYIRQELLLGSYMVSGIESTGSRQIESEARIDTIVKLYKDGNPNAGLRQLKEIEVKSKEFKLTNTLLARVFSTIGGCLLALEREEEAVDYISRAYHLDEENPDIIANYSLAKYIKGEQDESISLAQQSLRIKPEQQLARIIQFNIKANQRGYHYIDDLIDEDYLSDVSYCRIIGLAYQKSGDFIKGEKYLRKSLAINQNDINSNLALASLLIEKELPQLSIGSIPVISVENKTIVEEALGLIKIAISEAQTRDNPILHHNALAMRAGIWYIRGETKKVKHDCEAVLNSNPNHQIALHNRALVALSERDFAQAISLFKLMTQEYIRNSFLIIPFIIALIESNKIDDAKNLLDQYIPEKDSDQVYDLCVMHAWILIKQNKSEEAKEKRRDLLNNQSENYRAYESAGVISKLLKDNVSAITYLTKSLDLVDSQRDRNRIILNIADIYVDDKDFENAINWFSELPFMILSARSISYRYASVLFFSRNYGQAYDFLRRCDANEEQYPELLEMHSWLAEFLGDLQEALRIQNNLKETEPDRISHVIEYARLLYKNDYKEEAILQLNSVKEMLSDPWELIQAAELFFLEGQYDISLNLGYRARRIGIGIADIHMAYLNLYLRLEGNINLDLTCVQMNSAVLLDSGDKKHWVKLLDIVTPDQTNWEYPKDSHQAGILLGHKVGDTIKFREGPIEHLSYSILDIQSIFLRAYIETFNDFSARFPENLSLQKMQLNDGDYSNFFQFIAQSGLQVAEIRKLYFLGHINLEQFSKFIGRNQILTFLSLQNDKEERIVASNGSYEDQDQQKKILATTTAITVNITSLLTLKSLNLLETLLLRFESIYTSQRLVDSLLKVLLELDFDRLRGRKTIGFSKGQFFFTETPEEITIRTISYFEEILHFVKQNCKIIPISSENASFLIPPEKAYFDVGDVNISLILVAKQTNTPLFADDYRLRYIAQAEHKINGFWTQEFLLNILENNIIDFRCFAIACSVLAVFNYYYITVKSNLIHTILEEDLFQVTERVDSLLRILKAPDTIEDGAILVLSDLLKQIWLDPILENQRVLILDRALEYLTTNRLKDRVLSQLIRILDATLYMAPFHQANLHNAIILWSRQHPANDGLIMGRRRSE